MSDSSNPDGSLIHVPRYYEDHPVEAPQVIARSEVFLDEKLLGTRTLRGLDLTRYQNVTIFLTCSGTIAYQVVLGTVEEPRKNVSGGGSCGGGNIASYTVPVKPQGPFTQITATMPADATYYLTVYGEPVSEPLGEAP